MVERKEIRESLGARSEKYLEWGKKLFPPKLWMAAAVIVSNAEGSLKTSTATKLSTLRVDGNQVT